MVFPKRSVQLRWPSAIITRVFIVETLFLNLVFRDEIKAMPQKVLSDCSNLIERPLAYRRESDPQVRTLFEQYPIIPRDLCDFQDGMQREVIKDIMLYW